MISRQRLTDLKMESTCSINFFRSWYSLEKSTKSFSKPAFSFMIARGLFISWATPAASLPKEANFPVCSISAYTDSRFWSASLIRSTKRPVVLRETMRMTATLTTKTRRSSIFKVNQPAITSPGSLIRTRIKAACWR